MTPRVEIATGILGWMTTPELEYLERVATGCALAIELGSFCGRSSAVLAAADKLICVDAWEQTTYELPDESGDCYGDDFSPMDEWLKNKTDNMHARRGNLYGPVLCYSLIRDFSARANIVFIDANHGMQSVRSDILLAEFLAAPGGIICGHDYSTSWPSVMDAVHRAGRRFEIIPDTTIWSVQT